jgi:hypothetical protein
MFKLDILSFSGGYPNQCGAIFNANTGSNLDAIQHYILIQQSLGFQRLFSSLLQRDDGVYSKRKSLLLLLKSVCEPPVL